MVKESGFVPVALKESVAVMVSPMVPVNKGVPLITPVEGLIDSPHPLGKSQLHTNGGLPPVAALLAEKPA
jgi:hypothetical protein